MGSLSEIRFQEKKRYIRCLQEEVKKIEAFRRELPLSMQLLSSAIQKCKEELGDYLQRPMEVISSSEEQSCNIDVSPNDVHDLTSQYSREFSALSKDKHREASSLVFPKARRLGAFLPFLPRISSDIESGKSTSSSMPTLNEDYMIHGVEENLDHLKSLEDNMHDAPIVLSLNYTSGRNGRHSYRRKRRRSWSPELHRRFINALQLLGGPKVATPKLIRQLMNVDGLTNDEVKSHLQKHRLNTQRHDESSKFGRHLHQLVVPEGVSWLLRGSKDDIEHDKREHIKNNVHNPSPSEASSEETSYARIQTFIRSRGD